MSTFVIPYDEPLIKASKIKSKPLKQNLGKWKGLDIITIGKFGGKIVGYDGKGNPIYASSKQAQKLADIQKQKASDKVDSVGEWLFALGIPNKIQGNAIFVQPASAELLESHFPIMGSKVGGAMRFSFTEILEHVGKPLTPKEEDKEAWAASMASGEMEEDPFPDLGTLHEVDPGEFYGSHGNRLFEDPSGQRWVFKAKDPTIARAEEAAARVDRLIVGDLVPATRVVTIGNETGALIKVVPGEALNPSSHSNPPGKMLSKHRKAIAKHFVADWLTSNHDGHAGNFLDAGDKLYAIDKGQAWKFFGTDKLDKDYSPNYSKPIYNKFWNAVQKGTIPLDTILDSLGDAVTRADRLSSDQYRAIIAPYVSTAAGQFGFDANKRANGMVSRLGSLRADMEEFLSDLMGKPIKLPKKDGDNFETMPEVEGLSGEKLTIEVPGKPKVIKEGPKEAITTQKVAGWPATKGKVTINHPGEPSPGGTWPKGYPGPGFSASINYKKQNYAVEFTTTPTGKPKVDVYYPDGSMKSWPSPNAASESMALYAKGLPFSLSSTEKKKAGVSLPAKKFFGITDFKSELAQAHAGVVEPAAMTPKELEAEGIVEKDAPALTVEASISKLPDGVIHWDELPQEAKEAITANDFAIGTDYPSAIPPGVAYKATEEGQPVIYIAKKPYAGTYEYQAFEWYQGKMTTGENSAGLIDAALGLHKDATLKAIKEEKQDVEAMFGEFQVAKTVDEEIGAAPKAEVPETAKVPPEAPKQFDGPLPPGTSHTVKKKFPWGKGDVMLLAHSDGFDVSFWDAEKNFQTKSFKSLSAACDWVWVNQKGYPDAAAYKAEKKTNKIPSGGGWGFWGLKTKKKPQAEPKVPKTADGKPGMESLDKFPSKAQIAAYPAGTVLWWMEQVENKAEKLGEGESKWKYTSGNIDKEMEVSHSLISGQAVANMAKNVKVKVPEPKPDVPEIAPDPELVPQDLPAINNKFALELVLDDMKPGEIFTWVDDTGSYKVTFKEDSTVFEASDGSKFEGKLSTSDIADNALFSLGAKDFKKWSKKKVSEENFETMPPAIAGYADPLEGLPTMWGEIPGQFTPGFLDNQPIGTQLKAGDEIWVKTSVSGTTWMNVQTGEKAFQGILHGALKNKNPQMRVLDSEKFMAQQQSGAKTTPAPAPIEPAMKVDKPAEQNIPVDAQAIKDALDSMVPGDVFTWEEDEDYYIATKNSEGGYDVLDADNDSKVLSDGNAAGVLHLINSAIAKNIKLKAGKAVVGKPVEAPVAELEAPASAAWVDMPENQETEDYLKTINDLPVGTKFQFETSATGVIWTGVKHGPDDYKSENEKGVKANDYAKEFASDLVGMKNISYQVPDVPTVSESNWETMPLDQPKAAYIDILDTLPKGTKFEVEFQGKTFTGEKNDFGGYTMQKPGQGPDKKTTHQMAVMLNLVDKISYQKPPSPSDAVKQGPITLPPEEEVILEGLKNMVEGDTITWNENERQYRITKKQGKYFFENLYYENEAWAETHVDAIGYIDHYVATNIVLNTKAVPTPKKEKKPPQPKPKPQKTAEQKAKEQKIKDTQKWLDQNKQITNASTLKLLDAIQDEWMEIYKPGMKAWARVGPKGSILLGSPDPEFAEMIADLGPNAKKPLPMKEIETPLGKFWQIKTKDIKAALPKDAIPTMVKGPDGKKYPKGTTWTKTKVEYTNKDLLSKEPGFYKIKDHNTDPSTKVLKVAGTAEEKKQQLLDMVQKHGLTHTEPVQGAANWVTFVKTAELEKIGKTETIYDPKLPKQKPPFRFAPLPVGGADKPGAPGMSSPADLAAIKDLKIGKFGHAIRMGIPGVFKNGQVYLRKVKGADGNIYYEASGELEDFNHNNSLLGSAKPAAMPSAMTKKNPNSDTFNLHSFEGGFHDESGPLKADIMAPTAYSTELLDGTKVHVYTSGLKAFENVFRVRIPENEDIEGSLGQAFEAMGLDPAAVMRQQTEDDERIAKKMAIVKARLGPRAWMKGEDNQVFPTSVRSNEAWLDDKLKELGVTQEQVKSARFVTTFDNHQSVVFDDPDIQKNSKVKFVYMGMYGDSIFYQIADGSGWAARTNRYLNGIEQGGSSVTDDLQKGGANVAFCRVGLSGMSGDMGFHCDANKWKVLFNKRVLDRTDWRLYDGDGFGTLKPTDYKLNYARKREQIGDIIDNNNEIDFDQGIAVSDIGGILAPDEYARDAMIKRLKDAGFEELNGIPMEEMIQVQTTKSRNKIAQQFQGLKKGGIP
jgi:hypothetical protein